MRHTPKGNLVPEAGDSLLETWPTNLDALGTIVTFDSTSTMSTALDSARAAGSAPTPATPWYGDIKGVLWRADGTRTPPQAAASATGTTPCRVAGRSRSPARRCQSPPTTG